MPRALHWFGSLLAGVLGGGAVAWVGVGLPLAAVIGLCVATSAFVLGRIYREYPDRATGDSWADKRWTGLSVAVVNAAALVAVQAPTTDTYPLAAGILIVLVGLVGYASGSMAEMERDRTRDETSDGGPVPADD